MFAVLPFEDYFQNLFACLSEAFLILTGLWLCFYTDHVKDPLQRSKLGQQYINMLYFYIGVNVFHIFKSIADDMFEAFKEKYADLYVSCLPEKCYFMKKKFTNE